MMGRTDTDLVAPALQCRRAGPADIAEIRSLADRIWRVSYAAMLSPAQVDYMLAWMYAQEKIADEMADGVMWQLAILGSAAVGYLSITVHDSQTAELNKLYLLPELQGQGYGRSLLAEALRLVEHRGCATLRLRVNKTNTRALRAYERAGFRKVDAIVADIGGGFVMDDYVLARPVGREADPAFDGHSVAESRVRGPRRDASRPAGR